MKGKLIPADSVIPEHREPASRECEMLSPPLESSTPLASSASGKRACETKQFETLGTTKKSTGLLPFSAATKPWAGLDAC